MGEKLYRPIIKEGDHLVKSKDNEGRVRGVSQDSNNKTTDIVEWEEVEIETQQEYYELERVELTPEQQELVETIGHDIADLVIYGTGQLNEHVIKPWWKNSAKPWIKGKVADIKQSFSGKTKAEKILEEHKKANNNIAATNTSTNIQIEEMLDKELDSIQFDMSSEEAKHHVMKLIYHMIGTAYEIKILSNTRIVDQIEDEKTRLENQSKAENILAEKVANNINELLSDDKLLLDVSTSKQLFSLLGGGVRLNGEYVPVELDKVNEAINSMKKDN